MITDRIRTWIGRDAWVKLTLYQDGELPLAGAITKAEFAFSSKDNSYCINTVDHPTMIFFEDASNQVLYLKLGLIEDLEPYSHYVGYLTIYDAESPVHGVPWGNPINVDVREWHSC